MISWQVHGAITMNLACTPLRMQHCGHLHSGQAQLKGFCYCRDTLGKLLRFSSSKSGDKLTSLQDVVSRMQPNQKDIYFVATETKEAAESLPFVERLAKKDFEVDIVTHYSLGRSILSQRRLEDFP